MQQFAMDAAPDPERKIRKSITQYKPTIGQLMQQNDIISVDQNAYKTMIKKIHT